MIINHSMQIDLKQKGYGPVIHAVQGDANSRVLRLELLDQGAPWTVPEGVTPSLAYMQLLSGGSGWYDTLPDGAAACTIQGNTVTAVLVPQLLDGVGTVAAAIVFRDDELNQLSTFRFQILLEPNPAADSTISNEYYNLVTLSQINEAVEAVNQRVELVEGLLEEVGQSARYYVPAVTQRADGTARFAFAASEEDMPAVPPVDLVLPVGPQGEPGAAGAAATFELTGVTELAYGEAPTVAEDDGSTAQNRKYKLGIPQGAPPGSGTLRFTGAVEAAYNGSEDVEVHMDWVGIKKSNPITGVLLEETTLSGGFTSKITYAMLEGNTELAVTCDGRLFVCVPEFGYSEGDGYYVHVGNKHLFSSSQTDTGEPFFIMGYKGGTSSILNFSTAGEHTMSIYGYKERFEYNELPEEYLPESVVRSVNGVAPDENGNVEITVSGTGGNANRGFMAIAHRGYSANAVDNTAQAIIDAANVGFEWVEIDIRKCADGIYILSHDATVTLYSNGAPVSVTFESSKYSDIRGYTWDAAGEYPLCTLQAAFATMRQYGLKAVCDRITGTYADILSIAGSCGMLNSVMLSFWNHYVANDDSALLGKYKYIPIRIIPNDFAGIQTAMATLHNPIYADVYTDSIDEIQNKLPLALALNMPIICSGCTTANVARWAGVSSGAMTQGGVQFTPADFYNYISADFDVLCNIAVPQEITVEAEGSVEVVATSDVESVAGYIYAFSTTPGIVSVEQTQFGNSAKITITGLNAGSGAVRVFTPSGAMADISVTVSDESGTILEFDVIKGSFDGSGRGGYLPASVNAVRACLNPCMFPVNTGDIVRFTIPDGYAVGPSLMVVPDNSADYTLTEAEVAGTAAVYFDITERTADPGWQTGTYDLEVTSGNMVGANIKRTDNATITDEDIANLQAGLTIEIL